jgi:cobalt-zinc-cadmium efflux system membrane fusion protein
MTRRLPLLFLTSLLLATTGCNGANTPAAVGTERSSERRSGNQDEVVLSAAEQLSGMIETQIVKPSEEQETMPVTGRIALADNRTWRVGVLVTGRVEAVYAGLGDYVHKGQVLARVHSHEVHDARAQYETALSEMSRLQAAAALAQRNYDRMQTLLSLKAASIQQTEQARLELVSAQAALKNGQIEVDRDRIHLEDNLGIPADRPDGNHVEEADLVPVSAPGSGFILKKNVSPGATAEPSMDLFVIGDLSEVWMLASVRQENLGTLRLGQSVAVTLAGFPGQRFSGHITNLGQELDPTTRAMQVRIALNNNESRLKPEMLATAEIPVGSVKSTLVVPADALQQVDGQDVVFVKIAPDRFAVQSVRTGETINGQVNILEGLKAGELVVIKGSFLLKSQLLKSTIEGD